MIRTRKKKLASQVVFKVGAIKENRLNLIVPHSLVRTGYRTIRQKQLSMLPHLQHFTEVRGKIDQHSTSRICSANTRGLGDRDASMVDRIDSLSKPFRPQDPFAEHLVPVRFMATKVLVVSNLYLRQNRRLTHNSSRNPVVGSQCHKQEKIP